MPSPFHLPVAPQIKIVTAPDRSAEVGNWPDLAQWAALHVPLWRSAMQQARATRLSELDTLRVVAWVLMSQFLELQRSAVERAGVEELNPSNEALTQLRGQWEKILLAVMRQHGIGETTLDAPDLERLLTPDNPPVMVVLGRRHVGPHGGFTLKVAKDRVEAVEIVAQAQGRG